MVKLRKSKKKGLELIQQMQYTIDENNRFIEHLFLLLKSDPNRQMLVGDLPTEPMTNAICVEIYSLLEQVGKRGKRQG